MSTPHPTYRRTKRPFSSLHCPSPPSSTHYFTSSSSSSSSDDEPPHKKLAQSLTRLSLSSTPIPEPPPTHKDAEMKQRKSYEKDEFTTVIESLSTSSEDDEPDREEREGREAPFPRVEAHV